MRFESFINEAIKAAEWEEVIVLAWNHLNFKVSYDDKKILKMSNISRISPGVREMLSIGESIAAELASKGLPKSPLKHTGSGKGDISAFWADIFKSVGSGKPNSTPKTDFYGAHRISLKKEGPSQLMSGKRDETLATFAAAMKMANINEGLGNALLDRIEYGFVKEHQRDAEPIDFATIHAELKEDIEDFFNTNPSFKKYIVFEAMTGKMKFNDSWAAADHIMVFTDKGSCKKYVECDLAYASKIANQVKMRVSIKAGSSKGPQSSSFRLDIKESIWDLWEQEKHSLNELAVIDWIKNFTKKVLSKLKSLINKGIFAVMDYLGYTLDVRVSETVTF